MGAWGALIMGFFGSVFAAMTLHWQWHIGGAALAAPFLIFALIAACAVLVIRSPGAGVTPSPAAERAITWATIGEGVGLFLAANIVINLHRPERLLPAMALIGFGLPGGATIAGFAAAASLWIAAAVAIVRDRRAKAA